MPFITKFGKISKLLYMNFIFQVSFGICYIYTAELFPTVVRNNAVAVASMFARVGSMLAPVISGMLDKVCFAKLHLYYWELNII